MARSVPKPNAFLDGLLVALLFAEMGLIVHTLWDDRQMLYILVGMIVVVTVAVKATKVSFAVTGGWFSRTFLQHLGDPLKKAVTMKKWCDQSWQLAIHVFMTVFELYVLQDEPWWEQTTSSTCLIMLPLTLTFDAHNCGYCSVEPQRDRRLSHAKVLYQAPVHYAAGTCNAVMARSPMAFVC